MTITPRSAVIFDMDGTLIDSETLTEQAVHTLLTQHGVPNPTIDCTPFYGITWRAIAAEVVQAHPQVAEVCTAASLQALFHQIGQESPPPCIPHAREAVVAASAVMPTAIGTSGNRESVEELLTRMDIREVLTDYVCAEDYENSKPSPDCYLLAAQRLGVEPGECLVFEDSIPGLMAAKNAGMQIIAITHRTTNLQQATEIADLTIQDYTELAPGFFQSVAKTR